MHTEFLPVDPVSPEPERIARAAEVLRRGGLVAFPTETVYGLGANALDADAVAGIFRAKGRPANNPLIVHVAEARDVLPLVAEWSDVAERLARHFWPGPLTLVLPKSALVPDIVTAGGPTVAMRVPAHPVALALLRAAGVPIAAPSANRSTQLSPTRAEHVQRGLDGLIDMILDGGPTTGGLESTVLDVTTTPPRLLRPGLIQREELESMIGPIIRIGLAAVTSIGASANETASALPSPGMMSRHYAPHTPLWDAAGDGLYLVDLLSQFPIRVGWLTYFPLPEGRTIPDVPRIQLPSDPAGYAAQLYDALHRLDQLGLDRIVVAIPPDTPEWLAVRDRLARMS